MRPHDPLAQLAADVPWGGAIALAAARLAAPMRPICQPRHDLQALAVRSLTDFLGTCGRMSAPGTPKAQLSSKFLAKELPTPLPAWGQRQIFGGRSVRVQGRTIWRVHPRDAVGHAEQDGGVDFRSSASFCRALLGATCPTGSRGPSCHCYARLDMVTHLPLLSIQRASGHVRGALAATVHSDVFSVS